VRVGSTSMPNSSSNRATLTRSTPQRVSLVSIATGQCSCTNCSQSAASCVLIVPTTLPSDSVIVYFVTFLFLVGVASTRSR
jgi:hypothetical protein